MAEPSETDRDEALQAGETDDALHQLPMWVVYRNPSDYPGKFVSRCHRWDAMTKEYAPTGELLVRDSLGEINEVLRSRGLTWLPRFGADDPVIVGTWF